MAHYSVELGTPIYCCTFVGPDSVLLGGGGGASKSGVTNRISILKLDPLNKKSDVIEDYRLPKGEDAPMSVDFDQSSRKVICGVNSSPDDIKEGKNDHLRVFSLTKDQKLTPVSSTQTLSSTSADDYQRITCLSSGRSGLLAVGGTNNQLDILTFPGCKSAFNPIQCDETDKQNQLLTVDFDQNGTEFLVCSSRFVKIYLAHRSLTKKKKKKNRVRQATLIRQIDPPTPPTDQSCSFRSAKYGRGPNSGTIYTIVNHLPLNRTGPRSRKTNNDRKSMLMCWNSTNGEQKKTKNLSQKPVTAFDISRNGEFMAFASSDLSVGILDATSLQSLLSILHAHEFPVTSIRFSPDSQLAVSCSADMTIRVIQVPKRSLGGSRFTSLWILLSLIILFISFLLFKSKSS